MASPNILFLFTDQQRWDALGSTGGCVRTPYLDRVAAQGIVFVKLFQHNMDYYRRVLKPNLIYLDTIGGLPGIKCYDPCHPLTRGGTREARLSVMRVSTNAGAVLGAEGPPQDWNLKLRRRMRNNLPIVRPSPLGMDDYYHVYVGRRVSSQ